MTEEFKKAIESANIEEEKKAVDEKCKDELKALSEEELSGAAGGYNGPAFVYTIGLEKN